MDQLHAQITGPIITTGGLSFGVWILNPLANLSVSCRYRHGQGTGGIALCTEGMMPPGRCRCPICPMA